MAEHTGEVQTSTSSEVSTHVRGRVKWFNNKSGYGFITVSEGERPSDIFVHHSALAVSEEQYKYLVQGEYVEFDIVHVSNGSHEYQASNVRGLNGGKLMCETRHEARVARVHHATSQQTKPVAEVETRTDETDNHQHTRGGRGGRGGRGSTTGGRGRGAGRQSQQQGGSEWLLVRNKSTTQQPSRKPQTATNRRPQVV